MNQETIATLNVEPLARIDPSSASQSLARSVRAAAEPMFVVPVVDPQGYATGIYQMVTLSSANRYTVDIVDDRHKCPDVEHWGDRYAGECKHVRRVAMAIHLGVLPAPEERVTEAYWSALGATLALYDERAENAPEGEGETTALAVRRARNLVEKYATKRAKEVVADAA